MARPRLILLVLGLLAAIAPRPAGAQGVGQLPEPEAVLVGPNFPEVELVEPGLRLMLEPDWMLQPLPEEPPELFLEMAPLAGIEPLDERPPRLKPAGKIWEGRIEFGLNGSEGNSERFSTRTGGKLRRKTAANLLTMELLYSTSYANSVLNEDKALFDSRSEWPLQGSPWYGFTHSTVEYDAFTAYDVRLTADGGIGYEFIRSTETQLKTRLGLGFSQELGSPDERFVPEGSLGFNFEHQLTRRQKLMASSDIYPELGDIEDFRARSTAAWEIKIDPPARLSLRLAVIDRYDSTPNGKKRNDLDYSTLVVFEF